MFIFLWFTDIAQKPKSIDVVSVEVYDKAADELISWYEDAWFSTAGPIRPGVTYKSCITANRYMDTVLHARIGVITAQTF